MVLLWKDRMMGEVLLDALFISVLFESNIMSIIFVIKNMNLPLTGLPYCTWGKKCIKRAQVYAANDGKASRRETQFQGLHKIIGGGSGRKRRGEEHE